MRSTDQRPRHLFGIDCVVFRNYPGRVRFFEVEDWFPKLNDDPKQPDEIPYPRLNWKEEELPLWLKFEAPPKKFLDRDKKGNWTIAGVPAKAQIDKWISIGLLAHKGGEVQRIKRLLKIA